MVRTARTVHLEIISPNFDKLFSSVELSRQTTCRWRMVPWSVAERGSCEAGEERGRLLNAADDSKHRTADCSFRLLAGPQAFHRSDDVRSKSYHVFIFSIEWTNRKLSSFVIHRACTDLKDPPFRQFMSSSLISITAWRLWPTNLGPYWRLQLCEKDGNWTTTTSNLCPKSEGYARLILTNNVFWFASFKTFSVLGEFRWCL